MRLRVLSLLAVVAVLGTWTAGCRTDRARLDARTKFRAEIGAMEWELEQILARAPTRDPTSGASWSPRLAASYCSPDCAAVSKLRARALQVYPPRGAEETLAQYIQALEAYEQGCDWACAGLALRDDGCFARARQARREGERLRCLVLIALLRME